MNNTGNKEIKQDLMGMNARKWFKRIGTICLIPVVLVLVISILLYIPPFQNFVKGTATRYASEATGMQIKIDRIRLSFPLDLTVKGVQVITPPTDTVLNLNSLTVSIRPLPLLKKQVLIEAINLQGVQVNTGSLIEGIEIKGVLGKLYAKADHINLGKETATLNTIDISDTAITLLLNDTTNTKDTTSSKVNWKLFLEKIKLNHVAFALQMPNDSLRLSSFIQLALLTKGVVDLGTSRYSAEKFILSKSTMNYDGNNNPPTKGFDPSHIALNDISIHIDSIVNCGKEIKANIKELSAIEHSGLSIKSLTGVINGDSSTLSVPDLTLQTPYSEIQLHVNIPWSALEENPTGNINAFLNAYIGKQDVLVLAGDLSEHFKQSYPNKPITVNAQADGNLSSLHLRQLNSELPGAFRINVSGDGESLTDSIRRSGEVRLSAETENLDFVLDLLPPAQKELFRIPNLKLTGEATLANQEYHTDLLLTQGQGKVKVAAGYHPLKEIYTAELTVDSLEPIHFMPKDSLLWLTAAISIEGKGFDPFSSKTTATINGKISDIQYGHSSITDVTLDGTLKEHRAQFELKSEYPLAELQLKLDGTLQKQDIKGMIIANVEHLDLYKLHFIQKPMSTSFQLFAEAETNLKENYALDVTLGNWELAFPQQKVYPKTLTLRARSNKDTTQVSFHAGDLGIVLTGNMGLEKITNKLTNVSKDINYQLEKDSTVNLAKLRPLLPEMNLDINAGRDNPIYNYLQTMEVEFNKLGFRASTSPEEGIKMNAFVYTLVRDTMQLDTLRMNLWQDTLGLQYSANAIKNKLRRQEGFTAGLHGKIQYGYADINLDYKDEIGKVGLLLGLRAEKVPEGIRVSLFPDNPILAFRPFKVNKDNYFLIKDEKHMYANLRLTGKNDASFWFHSIPDTGAMPELHAEISHLDLKNITESFPGLPKMDGIMSADLQYAPSDSSFMVVADFNVDNLIYEGGRVGELLLNTVYLPLNNGAHQVDMHLLRDLNEVASATAFYQAGEKDSLSGSFILSSLPLEMVNPFIPEEMAKLSGAIQGNLTVNGTTTHPDIEGSIQMDTAAVFIAAAGSQFRFDEKKILVKDNKLRFDNYNIYAIGKNPFTIDGTIDFENPSRMTADLRMNANNLQLLNVKRNSESLVYGKLFVNLNSTVRGPLDALSMRGNLQLLGNTNLTYVMKDSPLTVQDRLNGLVTFTSFTDTVIRKRKKEPPLPVGGMDILMTIQIDPAVQLKADLSADQSSYVNLEGGGDLSFQYTPQGDMVLSGRYTLTGGTVKYALPIIPLKEFNIKEGSYVQWSGNPMDPTLNLTATERVRTSVSIDGQSPHLVNFDVGIEVKQTLENLSLQFILNAPEDMTVQNQLSAMGPEERSKQAVSMLVTGMYLASSNSGKVNMNMGAALNSFLQSEINNIAGNALKSVDITFGMESYDDDGNEDNGKRTDYSFRFAKRFYNDRIRIVLGGKISTGADVNNGQAQPFIDNVSIEYRLDASGTRYVKLFHDKNYESLLEGEITETGVGIVLRKKMLHLRELFLFKKKKVQPVNEEETKK